MPHLDLPPDRDQAAIDRAYLEAAVRWVEVKLVTAGHGRHDPADGGIQLREAHARLTRAAAAGPSFHVLADRFALTPFERGLLLLCIANEMSTAVPVLCGRIGQGAEHAHVSLAAARAAFPEVADWSAL